MKRIIVIFLLIISTYLYSDSIYGPFDYTKIQTDPIKWSLDEGIYFDSIDLSLSSDYGKIFYIINSDLSFREPIEYQKKIRLTGIDGSIMDYNILVILEKADGRLEFYSQVYRIDKTKTYEHVISNDENDRITKEVNKINDIININYQFPTKEYNINFSNREFIFPQNINNNKNYESNIKLEGENNDESVFLVNLTYSKNNKIYTEIHGYSLNLTGTKPPSFGSLYWGQVYKQSYKISIRPDKPGDKIYYWIKEWKNSELIFGPPPVSKITKWNEYSNPIELTTEYGMDGITGIAAFSVGEDGDYSQIAGPYYFKINGIEKTFEQIFADEKKVIKEKKVYLNEVEYKQRIKINDSKSVLKFSGFDNDDRFYFVFNSVNREGKSELLPCTGEYVFKNTSDIPVVFNVYLANGEEIAFFEIHGGNMVLPVLKDYSGNKLDLSDDTIINFYMPDNTVRYEVTGNLKDFLKVTKDSAVFTGSILLNAESGEEKSYKLKFAAFDADNKIIGDSGYYYFNIDKSKPSGEVKSEGVDLKIFHNEKQILKLIPPEDELLIYYRLNKNDEWILYEKPISFYPPLYGKYSIKIYSKTEDKVGNTRENTSPFEIFFDTRAIFVDASSDYVGNGTEKYPYNSLERAIQISEIKNIKVIYIMSKNVYLSSPQVIKSDIVIQPYQKNLNPVFHMETKSVWRKKHVWFDINHDGYLEIRNIDLNIKSGNSFASLDRSKFKLYDVDFYYSGHEDFVFCNNYNGKLGLYNFSLSVSGFPDKFEFLKASGSYNILKNLKFNVYVKNITVFDVYNSQQFELDNMKYDAEIHGTAKFMNLNYSNIILNRIIYNQIGDYIKSYIFDIKNSTILLEKSDFILNSNEAFEIRFLNLKNTTATVNESLFKADNSSSIIGANLFNSNLSFNRSLMDYQNVLDYIYGFRLENSNLKMNSSVIRNSICENTVSFLLNNSSFEGANNSIFNAEMNGRGFNFWVTDKAKIITVNSLYYFDKQNDNNAFIYFNNPVYDLMKPKWFSNIISTNILLLENLEKKDLDYIVKDFIDKNIYHTFTTEFNMKSEDFFIPYGDSPIIQGGIQEYNSPIKIPKYDFLGNLRSIPGTGIDIGAIQKSGNF